MANRRFTIWDVVPQTVHLARVRWPYFLVLLSTFITGLLLIQSSKDYASRQLRGSGVPFDSAATDSAAANSCLDNILRPWVIAAMNKTLTASQQEDFYKLSLLNCTMFKTPLETLADYRFINGTFGVNNIGGFFPASLPGKTQSSGAWGAAPVVLDLVTLMWGFWVQVAVAWGLHAARSTTTPSYNTRPLQHRDAMFTGPEKLIHLIREQFSGMVFRGVMRVLLTTIMVQCFFLIPTYYITAMISAFVAGKSLTNVESWTPSELFWELAEPANPLQLLFVLHSSVAALEPGMWGFKALFRGIQLTKGNRWNSLLIHVPLYIWEWLWTYIPYKLSIMANYWPTLSIVGLWLRSIDGWTLLEVKFLPRYFLVPAFYFLCKSCREKVATMA